MSGGAYAQGAWYVRPGRVVRTPTARGAYAHGERRVRPRRGVGARPVNLERAAGAAMTRGPRRSAVAFGFVFARVVFVGVRTRGVRSWSGASYLQGAWPLPQVRGRSTPAALGAYAQGARCVRPRSWERTPTARAAYAHGAYEYAHGETRVRPRRDASTPTARREYAHGETRVRPRREASTPTAQGAYARSTVNARRRGHDGAHGAPRWRSASCSLGPCSLTEDPRGANVERGEYV